MSLPSYVNGTSLDALQYETISKALDRAANLWPEGTAIVSCKQNVQISWAELREKATVIAANFVARGLKPGDRVGSFPAITRCHQSFGSQQDLFESD